MHKREIGAFHKMLAHYYQVPLPLPPTQGSQRLEEADHAEGQFVKEGHSLPFLRSRAEGLSPLRPGGSWLAVTAANGFPGVLLLLGGLGMGLAGEARSQGQPRRCLLSHRWWARCLAPASEGVKPQKRAGL